MLLSLDFLIILLSHHRARRQEGFIHLPRPKLPGTNISVDNHFQNGTQFSNSSKVEFHCKIFLSYNSVEDVDSASDDWIAYAPIIHNGDAFYVFKDPGFGGDKTIKKLDAGYKWSVVGDMITQSGRHNFNVIYNDNYVLIIGGEGRYPTEKCICRKQKTSHNMMAGLPGPSIIPKKTMVTA